MTTLADKSLLLGGDNKPPMLEKHLYDSWKSRMELYMMNRPHGRMILASVEKGPLVWPTITVDGVTRPKEYTELTPAETIQADCDIKAINIILQGLPTEIYALVSQHRVAKDIWEKILVMSSATSAVTYTSVYTDSEPGRAFWGADDEEISEGGIPRVIVLGYDGLPIQPVAPPSPDYIPGPEDPQTPPVPQDEDEREPMFLQLSFHFHSNYRETVKQESATQQLLSFSISIPLEAEVERHLGQGYSITNSTYLLSPPSEGEPLTRDVGYGIRDTWVDPVEAVPEIAPMTVGEVNTRVTELAELMAWIHRDCMLYEEDAQDSRSRISQQVDMDSQRVDLLMGDRMTLKETVWMGPGGRGTLGVIRGHEASDGNDMQAELLSLRGKLEESSDSTGTEARFSHQDAASGDVGQATSSGFLLFFLLSI
ncbi:hypothetical protein Tco_0431442 [Tanacetum coccineum]